MYRYMSKLEIKGKATRMDATYLHTYRSCSLSFGNRAAWLAVDRRMPLGQDVSVVSRIITRSLAKLTVHSSALRFSIWLPRIPLHVLYSSFLGRGVAVSYQFFRCSVSIWNHPYFRPVPCSQNRKSPFPMYAGTEEKKKKENK